MSKGRAPLWREKQDPLPGPQEALRLLGRPRLVHQYFSSKQNGVLPVVELSMVQWEQRGEDVSQEMPGRLQEDVV